MDHLRGILDITDNELEAVERNGKFRSREEIDSVYKLIDIVKDIYCIMDADDEDDGYSRYGKRNMRYYDDGPRYSYAGRRNAKRDSMGRYSRDDGKHEYVEHLRELMDDAPDEATRQSLHRMIEQME